MDKNAIKKYSVWARRELIEKVSQKALQYGIEGDKEVDPDLKTINGQLLTEIEAKQRKALICKIRNEGYSQVVEEVAYTWFNRFIALRFMEVNGYLPSHIRVFTDENNAFKPQILTEALHLEFSCVDRNKIIEMKQSSKDDELFKYLIIAQCNELNLILPGMFQKIADYTELLLPDYLLREGSVIQQMIEMIPEADWNDQVQIIGWLYQYYNSEKKDEIFASLKKNTKISKDSIPAATQLFTPDWIVRYMVQNSLGRLWNEGHPDSKTIEKFDYYAASEQQEDILDSLNEIQKELSELSLLDIKTIDPSCGSGHILVYLIDVLVMIYEEQGYSSREAIRSIVENNIFGLDIDDRAAQLSYFSVMMKACQYDRRFLKKGIQPHVYAIKESNNIDKYAIDYFVNGDDELATAIKTLITEFKDAKEYGSIIEVSNQNWDRLKERFKQLNESVSLYDDQIAELYQITNIAEILSSKYEVCCTNPPYMGGSGMNARLSEYLKKNYPDTKSDLFAVFIEKWNKMVKRNCFNCMVTMQSWMFIPSFKKMRAKLLDSRTITSMLHMDNMVMGIAFGTAATVFRNSAIGDFVGAYNYVTTHDIENEKPIKWPINSHFISSNSFKRLPGNTIAYWNSKKILDAFENPKLGDDFPIKVGLQTGNNELFLRLWFEVDPSDGKWISHTKGGSFRKWYGNSDYVINWENNGKRIKENPGALIRAEKLYFKKGITWSHTTSGGFSGRLLPDNNIINVESPSLFTDDYICTLMCYLNSKLASKFLESIDSTMHYKVGTVSQVPYIRDILCNDNLRELGKENIRLSKEDWDAFETSKDFKRHPLVRKIGENNRLEDIYHEWSEECDFRFFRVKENEETINKIINYMFGLQDELDNSVDDDKITIRRADLERDIKGLISYAVGCMFGRYSIEKEGIVVASTEVDITQFSRFLPDPDNVIPICDDDYFHDDIVNKFVDFIRIVYGEQYLEENLNYISDALGGKGSARENIRSYFLNSFYLDHCNNYSVTGSGKRPIYWMFDSGKNNGFRCLIYMHRYKTDTIARIRTDYIHELQARYRTAIDEMANRVDVITGSDKVKLKKKLDQLKSQVEELHEYEEKIHHLADQMISINLDDGVKKNYEIFKDVLAKIK